MTELGAYSPETAREILDAFRRLKASGLLDKARPSEPLRPIPAPIWVENVSGEEIPAYACMQATGAKLSGDRTYVEVDKPQDAIGLRGVFLFNGPSSIGVGKRGVGHPGPYVQAKGNGDTCVSGDGWAPQKDSWEVKQQDGGLFVAFGNDGNKSQVVRLATISSARVLLQFELTSAWTGTAADAIISWLDGTETGTTDEVHDPLLIFAELGIGDIGLCEKQGGKLWAIQAPCSGDTISSSV